MLIAGFAAMIWGLLGFINGTTTFMRRPPMFVCFPISILLFVGISYYEDPEYDRALQAARDHNLSIAADIREGVTDA